MAQALAHSSAATRRRRAAARGADAAVPTSPPRVTHPNRVIDPDSGVTKGELVAYYARVAPLMLPHLRGRPVSLLRAPGGVGGPYFFQKHADPGELPGVDQLDRALDPEHGPMLGFGSRRALESAAQHNAVEFHTWNANVRAIDRPDRIVFDLDPGRGVDWSQVRDAARLLRDALSALKLASYLKTSGGQGLHLVVPLAPRFGWDLVRPAARAIVEHMAAAMPERFVARSGAEHRVGKVFIDYLRNGFGATTVCAWSVRARPGLGISVPIAWDELDDLDGPAHWNVRHINDRLAIGNTPWAAYARSRQGLTTAIKALGLQVQEPDR